MQERHPRKSRKAWSNTELELLHRHYSTTPAQELVDILPGRTVSAINGKAQKLGLERTLQPEIWQRPERLKQLEQAFEAQGTIAKVARALRVNGKTLGMWIARHEAIHDAAERGRARRRAANPPK